MLIVPHALHCVDSCIFVFYLIWHSLAYRFGFSAPHPLPFPNFFYIRFSFFVKIQLLQSSQSCRVTPAPFPQMFYQI